MGLTPIKFFERESEFNGFLQYVSTETTTHYGEILNQTDTFQGR